MRFALTRATLAMTFAALAFALWRPFHRQAPPAPALRPNPYALPARVAVALLAAQRARH